MASQYIFTRNAEDQSNPEQFINLTPLQLL